MSKYKYEISLNSVIIALVYLILAIIFLIIGKNAVHLEEYYFVYLGYVIVGGIFVFYCFIKNVKLMEPITIITIIYLMFFSIAPLIDLFNDNMYFFDHNVIGGTIKATVIFILGYSSFYLGYVTKKIKNNTTNKPLVFKYKDFILRTNALLWIFCLLSSFLYLSSFGQNIAYILSFGLIGSVSANNHVLNVPVSFLSIFTYAMVVPWLYLVLNAKNKLIKIIITLMTLSIYFVLGFRFILLIMIVAPLIFIYLNKKINFSITKIIFLLVILSGLFGLMGYIRGDLRRGNDVNFKNFSINDIWYAVGSNFEIYKAFYRMVEVIPDTVNYTYGKQISYTLVYIIPRAVWPNKPDTPLREVLGNVLGDYAVKAGTAWPNIGEYYSEFGLIGVVLIFYLLGRLAKISTKLIYSDSANIHTKLAYSILYPTFVQLIIRGYTPTNFWLLFSFFVPILYFNIIHNRSKMI